MENGQVPINHDISNFTGLSREVFEKFTQVSFVHVAEDRAIEDYFAEYDHFEPLSMSKSYSKKIYQGAYSGKTKDYIDHLYVVLSESSIDNTGGKYYVVAQHVKNEFEKLEDFCECFTCSASTLNPLKYVWCANCTGCIKAGEAFANKKYVERAKNNKNMKKSLFKEFMKDKNSIYICESGMIFLLCFLTCISMYNIIF